MVKKTVLFDKIYNITSKKQIDSSIESYRRYLHENIKGFANTTTKIKKLRDFDKRFEIIINGPEEVFIYNLLKKKVGFIQEFKDIKVGDILKGSLTDVGKVGFGLFVDCAVFNPKIDILLSLHTLRDQLCNSKQKSLPEIVSAYNFMDYFPLFIKIVKKDILTNKIQGELDVKSLKIFRKIVKENIEGVVFAGATKNQVKKVIIRKGHLRDIISIERYGFLTNIVLFKENTDAPGIISHVGDRLRNCKMSAIRPIRIKGLFE
jgi:hypothetical protein